MKQALILVGGKGTRLGALGATTPKPLLNIGGKPFLDYLIEILIRQGIEDIILLAGHLAGSVEAYAARQTDIRQVRIRSVTEDVPAGTAGAILQAKALLEDEFVMLNGDSLFHIDLQALANICVPADWIGKIALRRIDDASRFGTVQCEEKKIVRFCEKSAAGPAVINGGVYILRRSILDFIGPTPCSIERDVFPRLAKNGRLVGEIFDSFFVDIGVPADFERAQNAVPAYMGQYVENIFVQR